MGRGGSPRSPNASKMSALEKKGTQNIMEQNGLNSPGVGRKKTNVGFNSTINSRNLNDNSALMNKTENMRRKSRMTNASNFEMESSIFYPQNDVDMDPLGFSSTGNLPGIVDAFKTSGHVCVERTLKLLNRRQGHDILASDP